MTREQAKRIAGNQPKWAIKGMRKALEMHSWLNSQQDWKRLEACYVLMAVPHKLRVTK